MSSKMLWQKYLFVPLSYYMNMANLLDAKTKKQKQSGHLVFPMKTHENPIGKELRDSRLVISSVC